MVAKCVPDLPASVAAIDRNFGIIGLLLSSRRSDLGTTFIDTVMFLNINLDNIAYDTEDFISTADAKAYSQKKYKKATDFDDEEDNGDSSATLLEIDNGEIEMEEDEEDGS